MAGTDALDLLTTPRPDVEEIARKAMRKPTWIAALVEELQAPKGTLRYGCEKVLRRVSELKPARLTPWFDVYLSLLGADNSFIKWGAILTVGNLVAVDGDRRFDRHFNRFYAPITGPNLVTAANIIGASPPIVAARPDLLPKITRRILKVEKGAYERKGQPSPECRNVACGQAIEAFDRLFERTEPPTPVRRFVERQLENTRPKVVKLAKRFFRRRSD